jgi:ubiquinol-cytochrome c reductase iron-sulfur subunit
MPDRIHPDVPETRRSFLAYATVGACLAGLGAAGHGVLHSLAPSADVVAQNGGFDVQLSEIPQGVQLTVKGFGVPIFIRHRTKDEIAAAEAVDLSDLPVNLTVDSLGRPLGPADDALRRATPDGRFIALVGVGSGLGCVPLGDRAGDFDGWFDPCRGTHYDSSGRYRKGVARENLRLPSYRLIDGDVLRFIEPKTVSGEMLEDLVYR